MAVDYKRAFEAAVNAAFNEEHSNGSGTPQRKGGSGVKTVVAGAALAAGARYAIKRVPRSLMHLPNVGELADRARDRLTEFGLFDDEDQDYDDFEDEDEDYDEPEDEADIDDEEDVDDDEEDVEGPEDQADLDEDEEDAEEPEDEADLGDEEDVDEEEEDEEEEDIEDLAPDERIDPASRPPRPPKRQKSKA